MAALLPDLAGKRPMPADRLDRASCAAGVEVFYGSSGKRSGEYQAGDNALLMVQTVVGGGHHPVADGRLSTLLGGSSDGANCPVHGHQWRCSWAQRLRTILPGRQLRPTAVVTAPGRRR